MSDVPVIPPVVPAVLPASTIESLSAAPPSTLDSLGTVTATCLAIGLVLKRIPAIPDDWIPAILVGCGIAVSVWNNMNSGLPLTPQVIIDGVYGSAAAVGAHGITNKTVKAVVQEAPKVKVEEPFLPPPEAPK